MPSLRLGRLERCTVVVEGGQRIVAVERCVVVVSTQRRIDVGEAFLD